MKLPKVLSNYENGNYSVLIFEDGTKIRIQDEDEIPNGLQPYFPEAIDVCVSKRCSIGCPFCHESATPNGLFNADNIYKFLEIMEPINGKYKMEVAIGGGALSEIPVEHLKNLLSELGKNHYVNITVNAKELRNLSLLDTILSNDPPINAIGVSFDPNRKDEIRHLNGFKSSVVVHVIAGLINQNDFESLVNENFKILILGYKDFGRGRGFQKIANREIKKNIEYLSNNIVEYSKHAKVISFDNLAIDQLGIKEKFADTWNSHYMGDEGQFTYYVDLPNWQFAKNSIAPENERYDLRNLNIIDAFHFLQLKEGKQTIKLN